MIEFVEGLPITSSATLPAIVAEKARDLGRTVPVCPDCGHVMAAAVAECDPPYNAVRFTFCPVCEAGLIF